MDKIVINNEVRTAVRNSVASGLSFALFMLPNEDGMQFYACKTPTRANSDVSGFVIASFNSEDASNTLVITDELSLESVLNIPVKSITSTEEYTLPQSTDRDDYLRNLTSLIASLEGKDAKVVISKVLSTVSDRNPLDVAEEYFTLLTSCMRALYYTPETGMWIVATPEVLIETETAGRYHTMSLAGTRKVGSGPWYKKNRFEHELVTRYIVDTLKSCDMTVEVQPDENLRFGPVEHLCNHIFATGTSSPLVLAQALSPTPAVCGWPVDFAKSKIAEFESHSRECYGGFIGLMNAKSCRLYVNLRSCKVTQLTPNRHCYTLFAGGGINSMSNPMSEWDETEAKLSTLLGIITNNPS